jgi:NAD(P)-dependent dehydrogenase (short-subunit alcohol dehydrogenase family)
MEPRPVAGDPRAAGSGKVRHKVVLTTGGVSGIGRAGAIVFPGSSDASYMSGQVLNPNGGTIVNG